MFVFGCMASMPKPSLDTHYHCFVSNKPAGASLLCKSDPGPRWSQTAMFIASFRLIMLLALSTLLLYRLSKTQSELWELLKEVSKIFAYIISAYVWLAKQRVNWVNSQIKWHKGQCLAISISGILSFPRHHMKRPSQSAGPPEIEKLEKDSTLSQKSEKRDFGFEKAQKSETFDLWLFLHNLCMAWKPLLAAACWTTSLKSLARCRSPQPWTSLWCLIES